MTGQHNAVNDNEMKEATATADYNSKHNKTQTTLLVSQHSTDNV